MKVIVETDRLLVRQYVEEDDEAFFRLNTDPELLRFLPRHPLLSVEQARQLSIDHPNRRLPEARRCSSASEISV